MAELHKLNTTFDVIKVSTVSPWRSLNKPLRIPSKTSKSAFISPEKTLNNPQYGCKCKPWRIPLCPSSNYRGSIFILKLNRWHLIGGFTVIRVQQQNQRHRGMREEGGNKRRRRRSRRRKGSCGGDKGAKPERTIS